MSIGGFSESEASALQGRRIRSVSKKSLIPPGSRGQVIGLRERADATYEIIVNWEPNPAFVMRVPIQAAYSKREAASAFQVID